MALVPSNAGNKEVREQHKEHKSIQKEKRVAPVRDANKPKK